MAFVGSVGTLNSTDAFVLTVDPNNGVPTGSISSPIVFGNAGDDDVLNSILYTNSVTGGGLVMGGYSNTRGNYDAWALKGDSYLTSSSLTSNLFDHAGTDDDNKAFSIIERYDINANPTYFLGGIAKFPNGNNALDISDIYKLDQGINLISDFIDGNINIGTGTWQLGNHTGAAGTWPGLVSFGRVFYPGSVNYNFRLTKFYFNGYTYCNNSFASSPQYGGPTKTGGSVTSADKFNRLDVQLIQAAAVTQALICDSTVAAGDNSKTTPNAQIFAGIQSQNGSLSLSFQNDAATSTEAEIKISDLLGRVLVRKSISIETGESTVQLGNITAGISAGVYLVTLNHAGGTETKRIFMD